VSATCARRKTRDSEPAGEPNHVAVWLCFGDDEADAVSLIRAVGAVKATIRTQVEIRAFAARWTSSMHGVAGRWPGGQGVREAGPGSDGVPTIPPASAVATVSPSGGILT